MIEIMAPVLDRRLLNLLLPLFATTRSGFGLDYFWHRLTTDPATKAAILDDISVTHTRPIGAQLAGMLRSAGTDPETERAEVTARVGVKTFHAIAFAGVLRDGRRVTSRIRCAFLQFFGLLWHFHKTRWNDVNSRGVLWKYMKLARYGLSQIRYRPELSILSESDVQRSAHNGPPATPAD
jgi:hypothetical protein